VPHFRGCSGQLNRAPRAYHSGDFVEIGWILDRLRARHTGPLHAVGFSLGGNALLRWAEEAGHAARQVVASVTAVCSPIALAASGHAIGTGLCRWIYTPWFLRSMKPKALAKLQQFPGLFDRARLLRARTLYDFDNVFTAPLHGFASTDDYWSRAAAAPHLGQIRVPALVLNAVNDPFVPAASLPAPGLAGDWVELWRPAHGGHCGFPRGRFPSDLLGLPEQLTHWMRQVG
jgi:predicted alpha/beta-fold hydrolase